jgi:riboflavin kinase / FMN adenylyltransferase
LRPLKVYQSIDSFPGLSNAVVTIGTFDGVHAGHRQIIETLCQLAIKTGGETVLLTFFPHPRMVLQPDDNDLKLITTMEEREELLRASGIDHLIIQPFSKEFSRVRAGEFVRDILVKKLGMKTLVIGHDHHFGRNREGSYKDLEEMAPVFNFKLVEIHEQIINHIAVSSTKIRNALLGGDINTANRLLGHDFTMQGIVVEGEKMGAKLGFPTANIQIAEAYKLVPADGIYAVKVKAESVIYNGMLYIGNRPALNGTDRSIEVNIFDFNKNIYGKSIKVFFRGRIRGDLMFDDMGKLKEKMKEDKENATKILS